MEGAFTMLQVRLMGKQEEINKAIKHLNRTTI